MFVASRIPWQGRWGRKTWNRRRLLWMAGVAVVLAAAGFGCRRCAQWIGQRHVRNMEIRVTSVVVRLPLGQPPVFNVQAELSNVSAEWMDLTRADYCLVFRGVSVRCDRFPEEGHRIRVLGNRRIQVSLAVQPSPREAAAVLTAVLNGSGPPVSVLKGTAHVETAVGVIEFDFVTEPIQVRPKDLTVELNGL